MNRLQQIRERHREYIHKDEYDEDDRFELLEYDFPHLLDRVEALEAALRPFVRSGPRPTQDEYRRARALLTDSEPADV